MTLLSEAIDTVKAAVTNDDAGRLRKRRELRRQIAECELARRKLQELELESKALDDRADRAADRHREVCEPAQDELAQCEAAIVAAMADRVAIDPAVETKRDEAIGKIRDADSKLEVELAAIKVERSKLAVKRRELQEQCVMLQVLENRLAHPDNANTPLYEQWHASKEVSGYLVQAARQVADSVRISEHNLTISERNHDPESTASARRRLSWHQATARLVSKVRAGMDAQAEQLRQQILDE